MNKIHKYKWLSILIILLSLIGIIYSFQCNYIDSTDPNVCSGHGTCVAENICVCHTGYDLGNIPSKNETCSGILRGKRTSVTIYGLGDNARKQLQNDGDSSFSSLTFLSSPSDVVNIFSHAGYLHSLLYSNSSLFGWGNKDQVGISSASDISSPTEIDSGATFSGKKIKLLDSYEQTVIVTDTNEIYGWGSNTYKIDNTGVDYTTPVSMSKGAMGTKDIIAISCGRHITMFLTYDGKVYTQGKNAGYNLLGYGIDGTLQGTPAEVPSINGVFALSSGDSLTHVILTNSSIFGWGNNLFVGEGTQIGSLVLLNPMPDDEIPISIKHGANVALVLTKAGNVYSWGFSFLGLLGPPSGTLSKTTYYQVQGAISGKHIKFLSTRNEFALAMDSDGILYGWGQLASSFNPGFTVTQLSTTVSGEDLLSNSRVSKIVTGSNFLLVDFYTIPYCFGIRDDAPTVCSSHGECIGNDTCLCNSGYNGTECQYTICYNYTSAEPNLVCSGNGTCASPNNCSCNTGYLGDECEIIMCYGNRSDSAYVCSGYGTCISPNNCSCNSGYYGDYCNITMCYTYLSNETSVCSGHGVCSSPDNCTCDTNYFFDECNTTICYSILSSSPDVCSGNGACISPDNCSCSTGFFGDNCSIIQCFSDFSNSSTVCSGNGNCTEPDVCSCSTGFFGDNCSIVQCFLDFSNSSTVCSGNGNCIEPDVCTCNTNYYGENCNLTKCNDIFSNDTTVCSGNGTCIGPDICSCSTNYYGSYCNVTTCYGVFSNDTSACSSNGTCISYDNCQCNSGYSGNTCNEYLCNSISRNDPTVCSGNGYCISPNNCSCVTGTSGNDCQYFECYGKYDIDACSGHGVCIGLDNCSCSSPYVGDDCNSFTCFDIHNSDPNVCSGQGECSSVDNCTCFNGYMGDNCQDFDCFGIASSNSSVCSSHGVCIFSNSCNCNSDYNYASDCSITSCSGILSNDSSVCSERGICESFDTCTCHSNFSGSVCQFTSCYDTSSDSSSVCSGNGICINLDQCDCNINYSGSTCSETTCFDIPSSSSSSCNGHGICSNFDECSCNTDWTGSECQTKIVTGNNNNALIPAIVASISVVILLIIAIIIICCILCCIGLLVCFFFKRSRKDKVQPDIEPLGNLDDMKEFFDDTKSDISYMGIYKKTPNISEFGDEEFSSNDGLYSTSFIWTRSNKQRIHPAANLSLHGSEDTDSEPDISDQVVKNLVDLLKKKQFSPKKMQSESNKSQDFEGGVDKTEDFINEDSDQDSPTGPQDK